MADKNLNVKISADASGFTAAIDKAQQRITNYAASTGRAQQVLDTFQKALAESGASTAKQVQQIANAVTSMDKMAQSATNTKGQLAAMRAETLGISSSMQQYVSDIDAAAQHTHEFSLSSTAARRELLVLAHEASQGSWKRFGGSLMVLGERTDALSMLMSGAGVTAGIFAAAVFGVAKAAIQGAEDAKQLNAAIQLTHNYAGLTRDTFADLAVRVSALSGSGLTKTTDVLRNLAATGQYTSEQMQGLATTILRTAEISGESLEDVSKKYEKLAEDPSKWAYEHNQSMHFMDTATYQHIQALQEAGEKHKAIQAVIDAATAQVATSTTSHLSTAAQAWHSLASEIDTFWSKLKQGLSTGPSLQDQIDTLVGERKDISGNSFAAGRIAEIDKQVTALKHLQRAQADNAAFQAALTQQQQAGVDAAKRMDAMRDQIMTNAQKREKELAELARDRAAILAAGGSFSDDDYAKIVSNINDRYKDHKSDGSSITSAINAQLAQLKGIDQLIQDEAKRSEATLKAQRDAGLVDAATYLQKLHDLQVSALDKEIANANQRAEIAKGKKEQAAYQTANAEVAKLTEQRKNLDVTLNDSLTRLAATRAANVSKFAEQEANALRKQVGGYTDAYNTRDMSAQAKTEYEGYARITEQYEQQIADLREKYSGPTADQDEYRQKMVIAQQFYEDSTVAYQQNLDTQKALRESYGEQFKKAYTDLAGNSQTNAEAMVSGFKTAFNTVGDALATFVTTGKASFSSFVTSVLADLAKIALHQAEIAAFNGIASSMGYSTGGAVGHYATGGAISGPGSGTSDSIPAMLSNGEYVINAAAASRYRGLLESINSGQMSHFATGGAVGTIVGSDSGSVTNQTSLSLNLNGGSLSPEDLAAIAPQLQAIIDKRINQRFRGQGGLAYQMRYNQV